MSRVALALAVAALVACGAIGANGAVAPGDDGKGLTIPRFTDAIIGAWADGTGPDACGAQQITYFSEDGVVLDLYGQAGPFHSFGTWRREGDRLILTHNEFPLAADGTSSRDFPFTVVRLDAARLHLRNTKGEVRERVRCPSAVLGDAAKADVTQSPKAP